MAQDAALRLAMELYHVPSRVRAVRAEPLPSGVRRVLSIAAGDEQAERDAAEATRRPVPLVRAAAAFYIEQILLFPGADSYRVLGAEPAASTQELRRNMALLLQWLHPDHDPKGERSMFATRVVKAWDDVKTPERRSAYDTKREAEAPASPGKPVTAAAGARRTRSSPARRMNVPMPKGIALQRSARSNLWRRVIGYFLGARP